MRLIECRNCVSPYCDGCNIYTLATMLREGKIDCLMDEHHSISIDPEDLRPKGRWVVSGCGFDTCSECRKVYSDGWFSIHGFKPRMKFNYCPNCGADMRGKGHG